MTLTVVFLHGWSVTNTDTYGGLPERLAASGPINRDSISLHELRLGRYVSFRDEVRMADLVRALESALRTELGEKIAAGERFAMITHSTGGPLAREWWYRYYASLGTTAVCPMSHLVMLAPANFGSALAQLGKGKVSQLKSWAEGVEPGQGVLDWLELGSPEAWTLNEQWVRNQFKRNPIAPVYQAVITGQSINRKLYDFVNSYTGENGSDGVVRAAAANLNAGLVRLKQRSIVDSADATDVPLELNPRTIAKSPRTAFRLLKGASHSGEDMGIMRSVPATGGDLPTVVAEIRAALAVRSDDDYTKLCEQFATDTQKVYDEERCELEEITGWRDRKHIHDAMSMLIFRVSDSDGRPVTDFDLILTGLDNDPNKLPSGFFKDRQQNTRARNTITYYVNHSLLTGTDEVRPAGAKDAWRPKQEGVSVLGLLVNGRPAEGFAHYIPAQYTAERNEFAAAIRPHQTLMIDIVLRRVVREGALKFDRGDDPRDSFKARPPGMVIPQPEGSD